MELEWAIHVRSYPGAPRGGDFGVVRPLDDGMLLALVDASGHGLTAYAIAQVARRALLETRLRSPDEVLLYLDERLRGGDGAAVSVAWIRGTSLRFAGVGNVAASVDRKPLLTKAGIVGQRMRRPKVEEAAFPAGAWLLMHTDGVSRPHSIPAGSAETAARRLVEANGSDHDDASVLLARWQEKLE